LVNLAAEVEKAYGGKRERSGGEGGTAQEESNVSSMQDPEVTA
jgi:hypothetical protein